MSAPPWNVKWVLPSRNVFWRIRTPYKPSIVTVGTHHCHLQKNSKVFISSMPCKFSKIWEQNFSYYTDKLLALHWYSISQTYIWQSAKRTQRYKSKVQLKGTTVSKMSQVNFSSCGYFMAVIYNFRTCAISLPKGCSNQVSKTFETYLLSNQWDKFAKSGMQPSSSLPNISCNNHHHSLQPSWRRIFSA